MAAHIDVLTPSRTESWRDHLQQRDWTSLSKLAGFGEVTIAIPREIWNTWGWGHLQDADGITAITMLGASPGERLLLVEGDVSPRLLRQLAMASWRHNPTVHVLWWCPSGDTLHAAIVDEDERERPRLNSMQTSLVSPRSSEVSRFIELVSSEPERGLAERARDVFRQETSTHRFFDGFQRCFRLLEETMRSGPSHDEERHDVALLVMLRLVVLYFLQARGALDGEKRYLARRLAAHTSVRVDAEVSVDANEDANASTSPETFWSGTLKPLFFGALNRPKHARSNSAKELGRMPFLNGGLFEPGAIEREHVDLGWPDETWQEVLEGFFEDFRFVLSEPIAGDRSDAIDPEVLGKVFEGIMYGDRRHRSGSFYTPRELVTEMVERTIMGHLEQALGLEDGMLLVWLEGVECGIYSTNLVDPSALKNHLEPLTILDPAVGTGAFLMEALHLLERLWRALALCGEEALAVDEYAGMREVIHRHLYGVDINATAVRLCELRFWLALLGTLPEDLGGMINKLEPLPNLGCRFTVGDSLVSAVDLLATREQPGHEGAFAGPKLRERHEHAIARQRELHARHLVSHGAAKQALRRQIEASEGDLYDAMIEEREERLDARIQPLLALSESQDLFGVPNRLSPSQQRALEHLRREREALRDARRTNGSMGPAPGFGYELRFADVMANGGFSLILTNPPWVRATRQERTRKRVQQGRYACGGGGLWSEAQQSGVKATFGNQTDLAALFIERSLELLAPGGRLCALVPSKLLRALHGAGIRGVLAEHRLIGIEDLSNASREFFDATTYPMILEVERLEAAPERCRERSSVRAGISRRRTPRRLEATRPRPPARMGLWCGENLLRWEAPMESLLSIGVDAREPWMLVPPEMDGVLDAVRTCDASLGATESLRPRRGVLTGCNDAFLLDEEDTAELFRSSPSLIEDYSRPVLGGRDISPWEARSDRRILWLYDEDLELRGELPRFLWKYLEGHRGALEARSDYRQGQPWWRLFRVQPGIAGPKVVWRDLSMWMEAAPCMGGEIPLNTTYYIPCPDPVRAWGLCALLNSSPARAFLWSLAERARGGWRRHFAWVVSSLPMPARWSNWLSGSPDPELEANIARWMTLADGVAHADLSIAKDYGLDRAAFDELRRSLVFHVKHRGVFPEGEDTLAPTSTPKQEVAA